MLRIPDRRTRQGRRDYALLVLMANTPLRKIEICGLRHRDLVSRGDQAFIEYRVAKKRERETALLPISEEAAAILEAYCRSERIGADGPLLLTLGKHGPYRRKGITPKAVDIVVRKYARAAGIKKRITPHSFRASYATQ